MAAEAAVSFAVETLGKMLIEKAQFLIGVEEDVKWLQKELKSIQCFMKDAAKKQSDDESIRNWISDIREVAHDAEDAIEIFVLKVQSKSLKKMYGCFPNHLYHLYKVGEQIKSIRKTLIDIQDRRVRYKFENDGSGDQKAEPSSRKRSQGEEIEARRRVAHWKPDQQVVGLEEDVKLLLGEAVLKESKGLSVAAIVGMGGLGKSTLANKIYKHPDVTGGFEFRAWVVVSSEFSKEDIMKRMLLNLGIPDPELNRLMSIANNLDREEELTKEVHKRLTGKRYFIVLDDVWEAADWQTLSTAFPHGDQDSRVLLTSRNPIITRNGGYVHNMKPLDVTESWDLFMKKAFDGNTSIDGCPEELKKVGEKILKKCGGLPLAITVVGGLLAKKTRSKSEWEKVYYEMKSHLDTSSGDLNNITSILELSYRSLAVELKACFLCLGFFEEDAIVKVEKLVHIWVALGLVTQEVEGVRVEEVARGYLNELISRNMIQVNEMRCEKVKACQMHDLLRDLSIRKAKEEIDYEVLREEWSSHQHSLAKPRHRTMNCNNQNFIFSTNRNRHLRSLFIQCYDSPTSNGGTLSYWKSFELLRVLDMGYTKFEVFPKGIGELTGLRYLRMFYCGGASRLPRSWAKLKSLEILHLKGYYRGSIIVDKVIWKMASLRHLIATIVSCEVCLGNMRSLETVEVFLLGSSKVRKILQKSSVSKLGFDLTSLDDYESDSLFSYLSSLENLFDLSLTNHGDRPTWRGLPIWTVSLDLNCNLAIYPHASLPTSDS